VLMSVTMLMCDAPLLLDEGVMTPGAGMPAWLLTSKACSMS
jgi:hypothetical protein